MNEFIFELIKNDLIGLQGDIAKAACEARFDNKQLKPVYSDVSIIRHTGTPECRGRAMTIKYESCVSSCSDVAKPTMQN